MIGAKKLIDAGLELSPVFTQWQVHCKKCGTMFYVDTEPESTGEEVMELSVCVRH